VTAPRDQINREAPGLPVALSNIAGVTKIPDPGGHCVSINDGGGQSPLPIDRFTTVQSIVQKPSFCVSEAFKTSSLVPLWSVPTSSIALSTLAWSSASRGIVENTW
jgi:hypothetical protein